MATAKQVLHLIWMEVEDYVPAKRHVEVRARLAEIIRLPVARPEVERRVFLPNKKEIKRATLDIRNGVQSLFGDDETFQTDPEAPPPVTNPTPGDENKTQHP